MRDLIVTQNITLDGVIEATKGWFDPPAARTMLGRRDGASEAARGRRCAASRAGDVRSRCAATGQLQNDDTTGITDYLNDVSKYVVSSTLQDPEWERTAMLRGVDDIRALKSETGGDIVTTGSIRLVRELITVGLVDEYRLFTYPVVLGRGQRLFADATEVPRLRLEESQPFRSGIVLLRYRTA